MSDQKMPKSFQELVATHELPLLVDFWAEWCGPCKMVSPAVEQLAKDWKGKVTVIKVDTDEKPDIASSYGITSIPTIILFKNGAEAKRVTGALPYPSLKQQFEPFVVS